MAETPRDDGKTEAGHALADFSVMDTDSAAAYLERFDDIPGPANDTIEGVDSEPDLEPGQDPMTAGLPRDKGTSKEQRRATFRDEYETPVEDGITDDTILEIASTIVDADETEIESVLKDQYRTDDLSAELLEPIIDTAQDRYVRNHMYYEDASDLASDSIEEAMRSLMPTHELRDNVFKLYDGDSIDPRAIKRHMVRNLAQDTKNIVSEYDTIADRLITDQRLPSEASPDALNTSLPQALMKLESRPGETAMSVQWDSSDPIVQEEAAERFLDSIGKDIQRAGDGSLETDTTALDELQDEYKETIDRFRVRETLQELEESWETSGMPYEVYAVDDPDEMKEAANELGTCRTTTTEYYEALAADPYTEMLGIRREDETEWIGMARVFHMETVDGDKVLAIDNLGMQYETDKEGQDPERSCNFEEYGDALPVMGLASIAYGIERGFDYVVAGRQDGRVGGGPNDNIGVAQLYSTTNMDQNDLPVRKKGRRDMDKPYGLKRVNDPLYDQHFAVLMEQPSSVEGSNNQV